MRKTAFTRELTTTVSDEMLDRLKRGFRQGKEQRFSIYPGCD